MNASKVTLSVLVGIAAAVILVWLLAISPFLMGSNSRNTSRKAAAISNQKQMMLALIMYCDDNRGRYPLAANLTEVKMAIKDEEKSDFFRERIWEPINPLGGEVLFNRDLSGRQVPPENGAELIPVFYDSIPWDDGKRTVSFADGHVKRIDQESWQHLDAQYMLSRQNLKNQP